MTQRMEALLGELARRHASGEELDVPGLMEQAGDDAGRFADLAETFLAAGMRRDPSPANLDYIAQLAEPPLLRLRVTRKLRVPEVSKPLAAELGVGDSDRLRRYYQRLEGSVLDPARVDGKVWDALERILRAPVRNLVRPPAGKLIAEPFYRAQEGAPAGADAVRMPAPGPLSVDPPPSERDDLDRLFLGDD